MKELVAKKMLEKYKLLFVTIYLDFFIIIFSSKREVYVCMSKSKGAEALVTEGVEAETTWDFVF